MAVEFPYMNSNKNVSAILSRMQEAGAPPKFTHEFLKSSLGFTSSNDRGIVAVLRKLGFLSEDGTPSDRYHEYRHGDLSKKVLAKSLREGWSEIFLADQKAYEKNTTQLTGIFKSVTGKSESVAGKMAVTFKTLAGLADWTATAPTPAVAPETETSTEEQVSIPPISPESGLALHHDIHVHLPATSDVAVYRAIFRAIREELS